MAGNKEDVVKKTIEKAKGGQAEAVPEAVREAVAGEPEIREGEMQPPMQAALEGEIQPPMQAAPEGEIQAPVQAAPEGEIQAPVQPVPEGEIQPPVPAAAAEEEIAEETQPAAEGETQPAAEGETQPAAEGETQPAAEGETAKKGGKLPENKTAPKEGTDKVNEVILGTAVDTGAKGHRDAAGDTDDADERFDPLPVTWKEDSADNGNVPGELMELKKTIGKLREGNLYKAVIVARELEQGKPNRMASGKVSRFLNSSAWDNTADANLIAANGISFINTLDTNPKSKEVWKVATLISNVVSLVTTSRNLYLKVRKIVAKNTSTFDRVVQAAGIIGDIANLIGKSISICNTIVSLVGLNWNLLKKLADYTWLFTGTAQLTGFISGSMTLCKSVGGIRKLEQERKQLVMDEITEIMFENRDILAEKGINPSGNPIDWKEDERKKAAEALLEDGRYLSEEQKESLIMYLGLSRRIHKLAESQIFTVMGLLTNFISLTSAGTTGANNIVNNGDEVQNKALKDAAAGMSLVTNAAVMANATAKIANRAFSKKKGKEADMVQNVLWKKIEVLKRDEYGLKGLEESMENVPNAQLDNVRNTADKTIKLYDSAERQFAMMGVSYGQLLKTNKLDDFKKTLIASM